MTGTWRAVEALSDLLSPTQPLCGRPKPSGERCGRTRMSVVLVGGERYEAPACFSHATDAERMEHAHALALAEDKVRSACRAEPVACWAWPVTGEYRRRVACATTDEDAMRVLRDWQAGRCAVCAGPTEVNDHDHETGLVRGKLCRSCNGREAAALLPGGPFDRYRVKNPASMLGVIIRYRDPVLGTRYASDDD